MAKKMLPHKETAEAKLHRLFKDSGIEAKILRKYPQVRDEWPCVTFDIEFKRGNCLEVFQYSYGIGHANYPANICKWSDYRIAHTMRKAGLQTSVMQGYDKNMANFIAMTGGKQLIDKEETARIACAFTPDSTVNFSEVFARVLEERPEYVFEDWAEMYGYDSDSRKAEKIYNQCMQNGLRAWALVDNKSGSEMVEAVCEL